MVLHCIRCLFYSRHRTILMFGFLHTSKLQSKRCLMSCLFWLLINCYSFVLVRMLLPMVIFKEVCNLPVQFGQGYSTQITDKTTTIPVQVVLFWGLERFTCRQPQPCRQICKQRDQLQQIPITIVRKRYVGLQSFETHWKYQVTLDIRYINKNNENQVQHDLKNKY